MESEIERILAKVVPSSLDTAPVLSKEESPKTADNIESNTESGLEDAKENLDKERRETLVRLAEDGEIDKSVAYVKKASKKVIDKL